MIARCHVCSSMVRFSYHSSNPSVVLKLAVFYFNFQFIVIWLHVLFCLVSIHGGVDILCPCMVVVRVFQVEEAQSHLCLHFCV